MGVGVGTKFEGKMPKSSCYVIDSLRSIKALGEESIGLGLPVNTAGWQANASVQGAPTPDILDVEGL
jgi:hypothetical protein